MLVTHARSPDNPTILFGAFDRHNFGDLLFPHVAARLFGHGDFIFAGLAARDLRAWGGHRVEALAPLAARLRERAVNLVHVGGEVLTCDAWEAAVMLLTPDEAQQTIARFATSPGERLAWARAALGHAALAPYAVSRDMFPHAASVIYDAVGGAGLDACAPALRAEVLAKLGAADDISVRDARTQSQLESAGIAARLFPDPAVMVADLFGAHIRQHAQRGELLALSRAFPRGYIAVQFSADFGDDATLGQIAAQLDRYAKRGGLGVVFFRAGAAPWHDDVACYERTAGRMHAAPVKLFRSLNVWDICALIAASRLYLGSSLHGRIVAMAFALPRVNLRHSAPAAQPAKQAAFAATWDDAVSPAAVDVDDIADGIAHALAADPARLRRTARELVIRYRRGFAPIRAALALP
ncbi:FIG01183875: hypothetical protein [Caballeronia glathei]|uniref:polysaccharide pyruvyl transferase family protein n=1 Tax=Caballeronia glathei TaxID=60547 RepID=UPI0005053870|nr:polysaccharide pyruvyl transferase family protein [Caballeronia glathei]CDY77410.1 FIG01183875: hypothetical protein [Caballeronia glathei]